MHFNLTGGDMKSIRAGLQSFVMVAAVVATSLVTATTAIAQVATVSSMTGTAQAIPASGAARALRTGDTLNQSETVATGPSSSLILIFTDGQIAALTANSRLVLSTYVYNRAERSGPHP
jgi:hypothetical protein